MEIVHDLDPKCGLSTATGTDGCDINKANMGLSENSEPHSPLKIDHHLCPLKWPDIGLPPHFATDPYGKVII